MNAPEHSFGLGSLIEDRFTVTTTVAIMAALVATPAMVGFLARVRRLSGGQCADIMIRWKSWVGLVPAILLPILLGASWSKLGVALLSLLCFREYARATGLFREKAISSIVVLGIMALTIANLIQYERMFFAIAPLAVGVIALITIPEDQPKGYIQRVALGIMGFLLFGYGLGYLGLIANNSDYKAILLLVFVSVELNDVFAYCVGRAAGESKLAPNTSAGKTRMGAAGALVLTTALVAWLAHEVFRGTAVDRPDRLVMFGLMVSALGQMGDLVLSSVKRDLGLKDFDAVIPGHGGFLDRFDSLVLVPPAVYHFLSYHLGPLSPIQSQGLFSGI